MVTINSCGRICFRCYCSAHFYHHRSQPTHRQQHCSVHIIFLFSSVSLYKCNCIYKIFQVINGYDILFKDGLFLIEKILLVHRNFFYERFLCQKFNNDIATAMISHWCQSTLTLVCKVTEDTAILTATMGSSTSRPKNFFCCFLFPAKIRGVCCEGRHSYL